MSAPRPQTDPHLQQHQRLRLRVITSDEIHHAQLTLVELAGYDVELSREALDWLGLLP